MARYALSLIVGVLISGVLLAVGCATADDVAIIPSSTSPPPDTGAVAVVELFTSEGCSSCPPADRLLRTIVDESRTQDQPVYALSFHVDYWNRLGWTDPYSDDRYSQRQRQYSHALGVDTYTPQVVVNGRDAMVGSRSQEVRTAITSALEDPARVQVAIAVDSTTAPLRIGYRLDRPVPDDADLRLAVVERGLSQDVKRGENAGRTLRHANVVRSFTTVTATRSGTAEVPLPDTVDRTEASVMAYVQNPSGPILGADRVDLKDVPSMATR
ncbi:MAG: DUF1223 domain-containing protein [Bacteroidetes bacterium SW_9_63_38]|nr:MAG: DUF1223 domain-containing protein [Bacteroidetes bacterium SW_9_63_38]